MGKGAEKYRMSATAMRRTATAMTTRAQIGSVSAGLRSSARTFAWVRARHRRGVEGRLREGRGLVPRQERLYLAPERFIARARLAQKLGAASLIVRQGLLHDPLNLLPAIRCHSVQIGIMSQIGIMICLLRLAPWDCFTQVLTSGNVRSRRTAVAPAGKYG